MKNIYNLTVFVILIFSFSSCSSVEQKNEKKESENQVEKPIFNNLNISFLLDLSDRINPQKYPNPAMDYYKRDAAYIKSVVEAFDNHLKTKKVRQMKDKLQLFFDPEPLSEQINILSDQLKFEITRDNASTKLLEKNLETYSTKPIEIYNQAIKDNKYIGSNTWGFFKNKVKDYCIEDDYRNILIILTDGYIYHKDIKRQEGNLTSYLTPQYIRSKRLNTNDWKNKIEDKNYGFIPATDSLSSLEVLILGLHPQKESPYEEDIIRTYWTNWLTAMNVKKFAIKNADLPSNMDKIIKDFILLNK